MPTRNINLTPQLDRFVDARIRSGKYANASEVLRAGLRALERREHEVVVAIIDRSEGELNDRGRAQERRRLANSAR